MARIFNPSSAKRIVLAAALLGALGILTAIALGATAPPAPTITVGPPPATTSTSATFSFTDSQKSVTFVCSLDGSAYTACTSPKSYTVSAGQHTFSVEAVDNSKHTSSPTSYNWLVVTAAPSIVFTFPTNGSSVDPATWASGCARGAGVCGTASDLDGVSSVTVSVRQGATGKYWNGSSYSATSETYAPASLTATASGANWFYALPVPAPSGQYTIHVRAADPLGLQTLLGSPASSTFTILPPAPVFSQTPPNPNTTATSTFAWTDSASGVTYKCSMENGAFQSCSSPLTYNVPTTNNGQHQFAVEAVDSAGNVSTPTSYSWKVAAGTPANFTISGNAADVLYPGGKSSALNLILTNPNSTSETVTSLAAAPQSVNAPNATAAHPCAASDFTSTAYTGTGFNLPPGTNSLSQLNVPAGQWPTVSMPDSGTNQDGCKGATVTFAYSGSAQS
jgi:hypothetical protein